MPKYPYLETPRLILRIPKPSQAQVMLDFMWANKEHFSPWDPPKAPDFYTLKYWEQRIRLSRKEYREGKSLRLAFSLKEESEKIIGDANFSQIFRGPFNACMLGYKIDKEFEGQGLMKEALQFSTRYCFEIMQIHRIQANYIPSNFRSGILLEKLGFVKEGFAKNYLFIDGDWQDHVLTSLTNPDPCPPKTPYPTFSGAIPKLS